jgi:hypothetical protein
LNLLTIAWASAAQQSLVEMHDKYVEHLQVRDRVYIARVDLGRGVAASLMNNWDDDNLWVREIHGSVL